MNAALHKRKLRWIDPAFQRRFSFLMLSFVILVSAVLIGIFWLHTEKILRILGGSGVFIESHLFEKIQALLQSLLIWVLAVLGVFSVVVVAVASFVSHRIVGPIVALRRCIERLGEGRFEEAKLHLREQDEFQDLSTVWNRVVDELKSR